MLNISFKSILASALFLAAAPAVRALPVAAFDFGNALAGGSNGYIYNGVSNYTLGFKFTTAQDLNVTELGMFDFNGDGPGTNRQVAIYEQTAAGYSLVTNTHFLASEPEAHTLNGYSYHDVDDVTLLSGHLYAILASGYYGGDQNPLAYRSSTTLNGINYLTSVYGVTNTTADNITTSLSSYEVGPNYYTYLGANFLWDNNPVQAVPEPGTLGLLGAGLLGLVAAARRKRA